MAESLVPMCGDQKLSEEIRHINAGSDPVKISELKADQGLYGEAISILRSNGQFELGLDLYLDNLAPTDLAYFIRGEGISSEEWLKLLKKKFSSIDHKSPATVAKFFATIPLLGDASNSTQWQWEAKDKLLQDAIRIIRRPFHLGKNIEQNRKKLTRLLQLYQKSEIANQEDNLVILFAIRYSILRVYQATELRYGKFENIDTKEKTNEGNKYANHALIMGMAEIVIKFAKHPLRSTTQNDYIAVRDIILTMIGHFEYFHVIDVLFDWLLLAPHLHNPKDGKIC